MKVNKNSITIALTLIVGVFLGWLIFGGTSEANEAEPNATVAVEAPTEIWTCAMHTQIRQHGPGQCPICEMDLIPLENNDEAVDPLAITMSPTAMQLANVSTITVGSRDAEKAVRVNGKVQEDERLVYSQTSHTPGRIEKLLVNFTGEYVKKGQAIALIYSPELATAQQELLEAQKIQETQPQLFAAAKEKLKNWKLSEGQINRIIDSGKIQENMQVFADESGYIINKMVNLGDYVTKGEAIYEIADLSKVWVQFDLYESDMSWVKKGDMVDFTIPSLPGENFHGKIAFLDPVINPQTRVAKARVEVANKNGSLKPEMIVSGTIGTKLSTKLNKIVVPKSAVMWTGKRSIVYVKNTTYQGISFRMHEVVLGPALGDGFVIESGLQGGEEIAVNGTFSIDAAAQLAGKPSMMAPKGSEGALRSSGRPGVQESKGQEILIDKGEKVKNENYVNTKEFDFRNTTPPEFKDQLNTVVKAYLQLKNGLIDADENATAQYSSQLSETVQKVNGNLLEGEAKLFWNQKKKVLIKHSKLCTEAKGIDAKREVFVNLSESLIKILEAFGTQKEPLYVNYCPMANKSSGAYWISENKEIRNPFMKESMLTCGEIKYTIK